MLGTLLIDTHTPSPLMRFRGGEWLHQFIKNYTEFLALKDDPCKSQASLGTILSKDNMLDWMLRDCTRGRDAKKEKEKIRFLRASSSDFLGKCNKTNQAHHGPNWNHLNLQGKERNSDWKRIRKMLQKPQKLFGGRERPTETPQKCLTILLSLFPKGVPPLWGVQVMREVNISHHREEISTGWILTEQQSANIRLAIYKWVHLK